MKVSAKLALFGALLCALALTACTEKHCESESCVPCDGEPIPTPISDIGLPQRVSFSLKDLYPAENCTACRNELYSIQLYRSPLYYFAGGVPAIDIYYQDEQGLYYWVAVATADTLARPTALEWFWQLAPHPHPPTLTPMRWYWGPDSLSYLYPPRLPVGIVVRVHRWVAAQVACPDFLPVPPTLTQVGIGVVPSGATHPATYWYDTIPTPSFAQSAIREFYLDYQLLQGGQYVIDIQADIARAVRPDADATNNRLTQTASSVWMAFGKQPGNLTLIGAHQPGQLAARLVGWGWEE